MYSAYHLCFHNIISIEPMHSVLNRSDACVSEFKEWLMFGIVYYLGMLIW